MMSEYDTLHRFESICLKLLKSIDRDNVYIDNPTMPETNTFGMDTFLIIYNNSLGNHWLSICSKHPDNLLALFEVVFGREIYTKEYIHNDMLNDLNKYGKEDLMVLSKLLT